MFHMDIVTLDKCMRVYSNNRPYMTKVVQSLLRDYIQVW